MSLKPVTNKIIGGSEPRVASEQASSDLPARLDNFSPEPPLGPIFEPRWSAPWFGRETATPVKVATADATPRPDEEIVWQNGMRTLPYCPDGVEGWCEEKEKGESEPKDLLERGEKPVPLDE